MRAGRVLGVLVIDSSDALARSFCDEIVAAGIQVHRHDRGTGMSGQNDADFLRKTRAAHVIAEWDMMQRPIDRIVFGSPPTDCRWPETPEEIDEFSDRVEGRLLSFLSELQAAGRLLARHHGGQIWVLIHEPSMHLYMSTGACPIESRAKQAAVKSFAKEILHLGVVVNCASIQLVAEQASPEQWSAVKNRLKLFALRFNPPRTSAVASALTALLLQPDLPMSGLVVPIGFGFAEHNI